MTVWLYCFAALMSGDHDVMSRPADAVLMSPDAAFVRMREEAAAGITCAPYSEDGRAVTLTIVVDAPVPKRLQRKVRP